MKSEVRDESGTVEIKVHSDKAEVVCSKQRSTQSIHTIECTFLSATFRCNLAISFEIGVIGMNTF